MKNGTCLKCNSKEVKRLRTWTTTDRHELKVAEPKSTKRWFEHGFELYPLYTMACMQCGFVELYMADVDESDDQAWKDDVSPEIE